MPTTRRDYYEVLGVSRDADGRQIKSAYRRLAVRYHPDRNPGDAEAETRFKEAAEAYSVLSDAAKRSRYDRLGHAGLGSGPTGFDPEAFRDFADILGDFFGFGFGDRTRARGGTGGTRPGADLRYQLSLTLEEAAFGVEREIEVPRLETCGTCSGSGAGEGSTPQACTACGGRGQVRVTQGFFTLARPCPQCGGDGTLIADPCTECRGEGRTERRRNVSIQVPAGVDSGTRLRKAGEGEHGRRGGPPGDLYVDIAVKPHDRFVRQGADIGSTLSIDFAEAVLGTTAEIETLHGTETVEIQAGTSHGDRLRLRRKGVPRLDGRGHGDHLVHVSLDVPRARDLSDEQVQLLMRWAELSGREVKAPRKVLERVRDLFG